MKELTISELKYVSGGQTINLTSSNFKSEVEVENENVADEMMKMTPGRPNKPIEDNL